MSEQKYVPNAGSLKISQDVIASIAGYAVADMEGVAALAPMPASITGWLERQPLRPISIQLEDGVAVIDIRVKVKHGTNVKEAVQNMTGIVVSKVNLQIVGVDFAEETPGE